MSKKLYQLLTIAAVGGFSFLAASLNAQTCSPPTFSTGCSGGDYIDGVTFNTITNLATGCGTPASSYSDYTAQSTTLNAGLSYQIEVDLGTFSGNVGVGIDYNQNGDFSDPQEFTYIGSAQAGQTITSNITIPAGVNSSTTVMRIVERFGTTNQVAASDLCGGSMTWGETEDYTVVISSGPYFDVGISNLQSIQSSCQGAVDSVRVDINNFGNVDADTVYAHYEFLTANGTDTVVDSIYTTIVGQGTLPYSFSQPVDYTVDGNYSVRAWITVPSDSNSTNDTTNFISFVNAPTITSLPYIDRFDDSTSNWFVEGSTPSWARDIPNNTTINSAASSPNAWVTNPTGSYNTNEDSYLYSPCFDFSNLTIEPNVRFDLWRASESGYDGMQLQVSLDTGNTWIPVGSDTTGMNWYNNSNTFAGTFSPDFLWDGNSNDWVEAEHELDSLMGEPLIQFRFNFKSDVSFNQEGMAVDNFAISPYPELNANDTIVLCEGTSYNPGLGSGTYEWLSENGSGSPTLQSDSTFNFIGESEFFMTEATLNYENIAGFGLEDTIVFTFYPKPEIITPDTGLCQGEPMQIEVETHEGDTNLNQTFIWSTGGSQEQITINNPGEYRITVVDPFGCSFSDTVQLAAYPDPAVDLGSDTILCEEDELLVSAGVGFSSYNWSSGSTSEEISVDQSGTYVVTVTNQYGCENLDDKIVTVLDGPDIDLGGDIAAGPGIYNFDAGNGYETYFWSNGDSSQTTEYSIASSNTVWVEVTDENGCVGRDEIFIDVIMSNEEKLAQVDSWKVYPNPAKTRTTIQINLNHEAQVDLTVMSTTGAVVDRIQKGLSAGQNQINLPLSNLESGVYFIDARIDGESLGQMKLIKQ